MPDKSQLAVGLDLGSAYVRCLILRLDNGRLRYAGHSEVPSDGWSKGRLADQQAVTTCVRAAVRDAEAEARVSVDTLVVGMGGSSIDGCNARGIYEFGRPRPVTMDDMAYAVERSEQVRLEEDRIILHLLPPGSQRPHHHVFRTGAPRHFARHSPGVVCRGGIYV